MIRIEHVNTKPKGYFKALENVIEAGRMTYSMGGEKMIIDHTEVNPEFKGRNIGKLLLMELVNFVRENKIKVLPLCPFAKAMFEKIPEIQDVL